MQIVALKVQVDNTQLTKLQADVTALKNTTITFKVNAPDLENVSKQTERYINSQEKLASTQEKLERTESKLTTQQEKNAGATGRAADAQAKANAAMKEGSLLSQILGDSIGNIAMKMAAWQIAGAGVSSAIGSIRSAFDTMKDVDSELVTIRKVTGATGEELAKIEEQAYKTASAYGVAANEYLESVAAFSRAGYGEQAQALAELATKTQIVGDTNQETANQFLLSVDAAYKYKGNIDELTKVLDGANEIDNKYATSIEKIAEGLGTVAPVAAQAHVGVDELTAAIGTITAVTQRSGSEAARAFRALVLNILGDTKTEIDEGVTWTTGEIAGLRDVVKRYAPEAVAAAEATGKLIDPMEAIGGLSQSMKDGLLTEEKLMQMVSDIGGKLRTSQLLALIENWDMYKSMLNDFANAAGSADKEVSNALNSWERKTQVLNNTWTEFVSHLIETDGIKGGLDLITGLIRLMDSDLARVTVTAGGASLAVLGIGKAMTAVQGTAFLDFLQKAIIWLGIATSGTEGWAAATAELGAVMNGMSATNFFALLAGGVVAGLMALHKLDDATSTSYAEARDHLDAVNKDLSDQRDILADLDAKGIDNLTAAEKDLYVTTQDAIEALKEQKEQAAQEALSAYGSERVNTGSAALGEGVGGGLGVGSYMERSDYMELLLDQMQRGIELSQEEQSAMSEYAQALYEAKDAGVALTEAQEEWLSVREAAVNAEYEAGMAAEEAAEASEYAADTLGYNAELIKDLNDQIDETQSALSVLAAAQDEYNQYGTLSIDTLQQLLSLDGEYLAAIYNESGALDLNGDAVNNLLTDKSKLLESLAAEAVANYAAEEAERLLAQQTGQTGDVAQAATGQLQNAAIAALNSGQNAASAAEGWRQLANAIAAVGNAKGLSSANIATLQSNVAGFADSMRSMIRSASSGLGSWTGSSYKSSGGGSRRSGGGGSGSRSGGGSGRSTNPEKERLEAEKKQLQKEKKELQKQRDAALKQNDIEKKKAQAQRDAEVDAIEKQLKELERQHKEQEETNKLAKLQLEVEKAELALMNVQNERTVRYYNAATGHWEWIAKNTDVIKAEQSLEDARKKLADEEAQQSYNNQLQSLKDQRDNVKSFWDETIKALQTQREGLQDYWKNAIARLDDTIDTLQEKLSNLNTTITVNVGGDGGGSSTSVAPSGSGDAPKSGAGVTALQNYLIRHFGMQLTADGVYGSATRNAVRKLQGYLGLSQDGYYGSGTAAAARNKYGYSDTPAAVYDAGGILHGLGGIKATRDDEIILPPPIARKMLSPIADQVFEKRLGELGYIYGERQTPPPSVAGNTDNRIGSQHNGDVYQIGNVQISEQEARNMSVYEFARSSRDLGLHKWDR